MNDLEKIAPKPDVMPLNREQWFSQLHLSNFVNSYYQFRDLQMCQGATNILIIGPGQGLDTHILRWRGYNVTTFDIDQTYKPDLIGSVHDLSMFADKQFDVVIASHVLEHLAVPYLDQTIVELARVARWSIVYLPMAGRHCQFRFCPGFKGIDLSFVLDLYNWFKRPDGITPSYCGGQHFWEVGMRGFRVADMVRRFERQLHVVSHYRNRDWNPSYNFILKSKQHP